MFKTASIPTNLFIDTPDVPDGSSHKLPNDIDSWPEDIIQKIKERVPKVSGMNTMVKFMKKDEENGTATGSVVITSPEKTAIVPVIVKDFSLKPLDVFVAGNKLLPLNPDYFDAVFEDNNLFHKLEEYPSFNGLGRFDEANLWNAIYPPNMGRYAYASGGYELLDEISDHIDGEAFAKEIAKIAESDPTILLRYRENNPDGFLKKIANARSVNDGEFQQGSKNLIPKDVAMVYAEGPNKYTLLSTSDKAFHPGIISGCDRPKMCGVLSKICDHVDDVMTEVDQNGEKLLRAGVAPDGPVLASTDHIPVEEANEFDHWMVKTKTGVNVEGLVIPKVIDFEQKVHDLKIFLGKTMGTMQKTIFGKRVTHSRFKPAHGTPQVGQTGTFVFMSDKSHGLATMPVTIRSVYEDCGSLCLKVCDLMGAPLKLKMSQDKHLQRIAKMEPGHYLLPGKMKWFPMEAFSPVSDSKESYLVKEAGSRFSANLATIICTGADDWAVKGLDKYANEAGFDVTRMKGSEMRFLLSSLGCSSEKIAQLSKVAKATGGAKISGLNMVPLGSEKIAEFTPLAEKMVKFVASIKSNLIKEASYMDNSQTVDSLLALNFVNPENINKFVSKIPLLKSAISTLASCLVGTRLGMKEIPEEASVTAMNRLVEVVNGLEKLRATQDAK